MSSSDIKKHLRLLTEDSFPAQVSEMPKNPSPDMSQPRRGIQTNPMRELIIKEIYNMFGDDTEDDADGEPFRENFGFPFSKLVTLDDKKLLKTYLKARAIYNS